MAGNTGGSWALPFPEGGDPLAEGDNTIRSLAEKTSTVLDQNLGKGAVSGVLCANGAGWSGSMLVDYRAGWAFVQTPGIYKSGWGAGEVVATIPAGYRPSSRLVAIWLGTNSGIYVSLFLDETGNLSTVAPNPSESGLVGFFSYPVWAV